MGRRLFEGVARLSPRVDAKRRAEHEKRLACQRRNNELAGVKKSLPLSEFDEILADVPWYMCPPAVIQGAAEENGSNELVSCEEDVVDEAKKESRCGRREQRAKKESRNKKKKSRKQRSSSSSSGNAVAKRRFAGLRREREERERQESARAAALFSSLASHLQQR